MGSVPYICCIMSVILNLETATTNCSVSISKAGKLVALIENDTPNYSHAEQLHVFVQDALKQIDLKPKDLDAVAVSKGPGSYTGLRIGVSAAKGLCFSLNIPLISVSTLKSMALQVAPDRFDYIIPLLDARRMEVYSAVFDKMFHQVRETQAEIVLENSFGRYLKEGNVILVGSGAEKCQGILESSHITFDESVVPSAKQMVELSYQKFKAGDFEDIAYLEPYYLKDFILQKKK